MPTDDVFGGIPTVPITQSQKMYNRFCNNIFTKFKTCFWGKQNEFLF